MVTVVELKGYYLLAGEFTPAVLSVCVGALTDVPRTSVLPESSWEDVKGQSNRNVMNMVAYAWFSSLPITSDDAVSPL